VKSGKTASVIDKVTEANGVLGLHRIKALQTPVNVCFASIPRKLYGFVGCCDGNGNWADAVHSHGRIEWLLKDDFVQDIF
jgi:hypothetical protein